MFKTKIAALIGGTAMILALNAGEASAAETKCYPIATLKISFSVVFPKSKQITMEGAHARAYLAEYNSFGRQTKFAGETLLLNVLPNGTTMVVPLKDGLGCHRMLVGPKLHKVIMTKVARGAV